jgi:hypothetical protein
MKLLNRLAVFLILLGLFATSTSARVVRVEVLSRTPFASQVGVPSYEKIMARVHFAIGQRDASNRAIVDLGKAPHNADGEVEFTSDLFLMRPLDHSNGVLLLEIPNRGGKGMLTMLDGGRADPATAADLGDSWLLKQGFTFAVLGWQWDVVREPGYLGLDAPIAYDVKDLSLGDKMPPSVKHLTGLLRSDYTPSEPMTELPLGHLMGSHLGGTEYPVSDPKDARNVLTVRDTPHGQRRVIPRAQWSFEHMVGGKLETSDRFVHLASGFVPGKIYALVYTVQDPVVAGVGFAAVRDFVSWLKHSSDAIAPVKYAYATGISQCGRFLRDYLYEGFNADETGKIVLDGVLAHVGGAGRGSFNYRFAQPSRDAQPMSSIDWPTDIYPFTDQPENDPAHPSAPKIGLLDVAKAEHVVPKIFFSHTSYEYWGRAASLIHTTADGKADVALGEDVRIYFYAGLQHFSVAFPPLKGTGDRLGQQLPSPLPVRWFWRAMVANMDAWVRTGTAPPASRYPKIADGTLVSLEKLKFPKIAGIVLPASNAQGWDLDFGPNWRDGILSKQPPTVLTAYPTLVPQVDADGNDLGGIRLPEVAVPLATYTGWNLRDPSIGAPRERTAFLVSFLPIPKTAAQAANAHDPRLPIEARYKDYADYRTRFETALDGLIHERYLLPEDKAALMERSKQEWDWIDQ